MASKRSRLAQRRRAVGYSQEKLAERLAVERSTVVRWEAAETEPQPWIRPRLAAALRITPDQLDELLRDVGRAGQVELSERMRYVRGRPSTVDLVVAAYLQESIHRLDEQYDKSPSTTLLGPASNLHAQVSYFRDQTTNPRVRLALYEVEAQSATFMGQLAWDVSQRRDQVGPISYLDQAAYAARQVHDSCAESYAVLRKSYVALYGEKDPVKGLALASVAARAAENCSPSLTGLALLHVAESYAMNKNVQCCEQALMHAEAQFDRIHTNDAAAAYYSMDEFNRLAGSCYLFLGLPHRAQPVLERATEALARKPKSQAIALGNLTLSLLRQGKLDEASASMHCTIDAVELTRGGGGINLAFAVGRELKRWRDKVWVQDINDRLLDLMAAG